MCDTSAVLGQTLFQLSDVSDKRQLPQNVTIHLLNMDYIA